MVVCLWAAGLDKENSGRELERNRADGAHVDRWRSLILIIILLLLLIIYYGLFEDYFSAVVLISVLSSTTTNSPGS